MQRIYKLLPVLGIVLTFTTQASLPERKFQEVQKTARSKARQTAKTLKKKLHNEAIKAILQVEAASNLLNLGKTKPAIKKLQSSLARIESAIASEKEDALLAIDSVISIEELVTTPKLIEAEIHLAQQLLRDRDIQAARQLMAKMKSEITVTTTYLPLGIYPGFIKQAISELSENRISDAKDSLYLAESSIVQEYDVMPIPLLSAEESIEIARSLHKEKKSKEALSFVSFAQDELKIARSLGYAPRHGNIYKQIRKEIAKTKREIKKGKNTSLFSSITRRIKKLFKHSQKSNKNKNKRK